jgi:chromosome segregation ATPase
MYVTLNGDWIASGQFVNAGDARDVEEGAGLLAFKRELRELETRAEALSREVDAAAKSAKDTRTRLVELEDAVVLLNEAIGREERDALAREHTTPNVSKRNDSKSRTAGRRHCWKLKLPSRRGKPPLMVLLKPPHC